MLIPNPRGHYSFLRGIGPYSAGVVAHEFATIEHVRFPREPFFTLAEAFDFIDAYLRTVGQPRASLCALALRSPAPFTFEGFDRFNAGYVHILKSWDLFVDGVNPIARTNVAPAVDPPEEPTVYSFAYTTPSAAGPRSFIVSGAGELPEGSLDPHDIVPGPVSDKARFVLSLMESRLHGLAVSWSDVTTTNIYTVHDVNALLAAEILPRIGRAARHGVQWHYARPPILGIEYEMDVRGVQHDRMLECSPVSSGGS
jgi:hypothetical protein